ncbi:hypothetical protein P3T27_001552 [Kitasatospora sp. MAA19]|nr:hypothetical protein [Kitasatospora sp. MAA19]
MFNRSLYSSATPLNVFEIMGAVGAAPGVEGTPGATSTDTGWSLVSG